MQIAKYLAVLVLALLATTAWAQQNPLRPLQLSEAERQQYTTERDRLFNEAVQLATQDRLMSAVKSAKAALEIQRQRLGMESEETCLLLEMIATWQERRADYADAAIAWNHLIPLAEKVRGREHWANRSLRLVADSCRYAATLAELERQRLAEAARLGFHSEQLYSAEKYQESLQKATASLAARKSLLGLEDLITARSLHMIGACHLVMGDAKAAQPYLEQAAEIRERCCGIRHAETLTTLATLANLYAKIGDAEHARAVMEKSAIGSPAVYGPTNPTSIQAVVILGNFLREQNEFKEAEQWLKVALLLQRKRFGEKHESVGQTLGQLGAVCIGTKEFAAAKQYLNGSRKIFEAIGETDGPLFARTLVWLGTLSRVNKDYDEAVRQLDQAIDILTRKLGEAHPQTVEAIHVLAMFLPPTGDSTRTERTLKQLLKIYEQAPEANDMQLGMLHFELGVLYCGWNDFGTAENHLKRAVKSYERKLGEDHADTATVEAMLALIDAKFGRYTKAEETYRRALAICEASLGPNHQQTRGVMLALGNIHTLQGKRDEAERLLRTIIALPPADSPNERYEHAIVLEKLAGLALYRLDYAEALKLCNQTLEIYEQALPKLHPNWSESLLMAGIAQLALKEPAEAKQFADRALEIARLQLDATAKAQAERQQLSLNMRLRSVLDLHLSLPASQAAAVENYRHVLHWKGAIQARQIRVRRDQRDDDAPLVEELQQVCSRLTTLQLKVPEPAEQPAWVERIEGLKRRKESLEADLSARGHETNSQRLAATPEQLQAALPAETALVDLLEYVAFSGGRDKSAPDENRYLAFVTRRGQPVVRVDLGPAGPINDAVKRWREERLFATESVNGDPAMVIKELVWQPIQPLLAGCKTILCSPDSDLAKFPFAALPGQRPGSFLIEDVAIGMVPVPQMLPEVLAGSGAAHGANQSPALLLVGDIDYDSAAGESAAEVRGKVTKDELGGGLLSFDRLKAARGEMEAIASLFGRQFAGGKLSWLDGAAATEMALRREAPLHTSLLIVTHGFFAAPNVTAALEVQDQLLGVTANKTNHSGTLCGLAMAGANRAAEPDGDDGILTAHEVAALDLRNMDLAVLSGCETAVGQSSTGEGAMGLQRAFQVAGARTTVASLWNVPDKKTSQLMQRFYANLWERRMSKLEALREAQIWVMHGGGSGAERLAPYHWAAFQLSGDWR
jgi:CHAT domain-containing protein